MALSSTRNEWRSPSHPSIVLPSKIEVNPGSTVNSCAHPATAQQAARQIDNTQQRTIMAAGTPFQDSWRNGEKGDTEKPTTPTIHKRFRTQARRPVTP
jgi:hypothetical protein